MSYSRVIVFISTLFCLSVGLTGCNSGGGSGGDSGGPVAGVPGAASTTEVRGLWLQKKDAEELRTTGKLQSYCARLIQNPNTKMLNTYHITEAGQIYLYHPELGDIEQLHFGQLQNDGIVQVTKSFSDDSDFEKMNMRIKLIDGELHSIAENKENQAVLGSLTYVRTSDEELRAYFAAQKACKP